MTTTIGILEGSLRKASLSRAVARAATELAPAGMTVVTLPGPGLLPHFDQDLLDEGVPESVMALSAAIARVDGLLIVTPEYNWSFPGVLKNAIDWLSRLKPNPLESKPVAIWSVSPGILGGARLHQALRNVLHSQDMLILAKPEIQVAGASTKVDVQQGSVTDVATRDVLRGHLDKFKVFARARTGAPA